MKKFFLKRALREKVLLLVFAVLAVAIWGSSSLKRTRAAWTDWSSAREEFKTQELWLQNAPQIAERAEKATQRLEPAKTLNATRLVGELNTIASTAGLAADIGSQRTQTTDQFSFHSVQVNLRRIDLNALVRIYAELLKRSPYMALDQFTLTTDRANPGQLNVSLRVVSVELAK